MKSTVIQFSSVCNVPPTRVLNWFNLDRNIPFMTTDLHLRKKLTNLYIYSVDFYGAETWTFRKVDQKWLENIEMWCCRRKVTISPTEELHRNKEERNILHTIKRGNPTFFMSVKLWLHSDMCIWAPSSWSQRTLRAQVWVPSGTSVKQQGSHKSIWGTKAPSIKA